MKRFFSFLFSILFVFSLTASFSSCKTGEGCGLEEKYNKEVDLSKTKRGKSNLFSKKNRKKTRSK